MRLSALAPLLLAAAAAAQSVSTILPMGYEWIDASGSTEVPFGLGAGRVQQIWPTSHVQGPQVMIIYGLSVRSDRTAVAVPAFPVEMEMALSSTAATIKAPSATFAANLGNDYTVVLNRRFLAFPATAPTGSVPNPFLPPVWFDRPFLFNKTQAPPGLLWETKVFSSPSSPGATLKLDSFGPAISLLPPKGVSAAGCPALLAGKPLSLAAAFSSTLPITLTLTLKEGPPSMPVAIFLGLDAVRFGGQPLPIDLGPYGMPSCSLFIDLLLPVVGSTDPQGALTMPLQVPSSVPVPASFPFYAQAFAPAPGVNPLGLAASNGASALTQGVPQAVRVIDRSSPAAVTGQVEVSLAAVTAIWRN